MIFLPYTNLTSQQMNMLSFGIMAFAKFQMEYYGEDFNTQFLKIFVYDSR